KVSSRPEGCQIRFINQAGETTAENPDIELVDLDCSDKSETQLPFPFALTPANPGRVDWVAIHPQGHEDYIIFNASYNPDDRNYKIWVRLPRPNQPVSHDSHKIDFFLGLNLDVEYAGKVRVMAKNFPSSVLTFKVVFTVQDGACRFTLTKVQQCISSTPE
ncbi:MAG TPA: hypothetical protein VK785_02865, partial [Opitutaceae bacterium]|nr:hypothetical protein [Opitutaceae bacterium]